MNISKRLLKIAEFVDKDKVVFDVGSDHALLPCFLIKNNITNKVYAGDNKIGPLNKAKANIINHQLVDKVIPVLSDGLEMALDDVQIVTISGMGQAVALKILDKADLSKYDKVIMQVNRDSHLLRKYISDYNYTILDEEIVYDGFYYEIIVFNTNYHQKYSAEEIRFGPFNLIKRTLDFKNYLRFNLKKFNDILKRHPKADVKEKINEIEKILQKYF